MLPCPSLILATLWWGLRHLHFIAEENESQTEKMSYPKPHGRAGNQAQLHQTPKSTLLHCISRKSWSRWLEAGQLAGALWCESLPPRPLAFPEGVHFCLMDLWDANVLFEKTKFTAKKNQVINNCMALYSQLPGISVDSRNGGSCAMLSICG